MEHRTPRPPSLSFLSSSLHFFSQDAVFHAGAQAHQTGEISRKRTESGERRISLVIIYILIPTPRRFRPYLHHHHILSQGWIGTTRAPGLGTWLRGRDGATRGRLKQGTEQALDRGWFTQMAVQGVGRLIIQPDRAVCGSWGWAGCREGGKNYN